MPANGIALDYSYTPVYDATYIKGIGNLSEKDCGDQSGWVYKVNGWVADTSCSQYQVTAGDSIRRTLV